MKKVCLGIVGFEVVEKKENKKKPDVRVYVGNNVGEE